MAVAVVSDTTHYLPRPLAAELHEVSLHVGDPGDPQEALVREADVTDLGAFYEGLRTARRLPTTSEPSVGEFLAVYEPLLRAGRDIVSVHLSAGISGTHAAALQARDATGEPDRIEVVDSATACGGLGIVLLAALHAARCGADAPAVAAHALRTRGALRTWFCVDTLEYLRRGGRVGAARTWLGGALRIKPILAIEEQITPVERVRTSARAFERMVEYMQLLHEDGCDAWAVQHIGALAEADRLADRGRAVFATEPLFVAEVGPVIGAHVGPGLLGVGGVPPALLHEPPTG